MSIASAVLLAGYALNFIFVAYVLFFARDDSARRFSWLLAIAFIPVAGIVLYVLFSGNFFTRTKRMLRATARANAYYRDILRDQHRDLDALIQSGGSRDLEDYGPLIHMNLLYGKSPVLAHNAIDVFKSGEEKYRSLFAELELARDSVNLSYFIINDDGTGRELIAILARKAREGVAVRLLYDSVGSILTPSRLFAPLRKAGGEVSRFFPVSILMPFSLNYRNHRKIAVIDGKAGYFGGMNIGDEYANRNGARRFYWRDTHLRVTGPAVQLLQKQFLVDWYTSTARESTPIETLPIERFFPLASARAGAGGGSDDTFGADLPRENRTENVTAQIVAAGPDDAMNDEIRDAMTLMILRAKKTVCIETPYFTPDAVFFSALKIASLSGTDVRVIVPGTWDKWYVRLAAMPYIEELLSYGVRFFRYPGFIHSKMMVIDGRIATIGSTNVDARSFSLHFELNAFFYTQEFGARCAAMFAEDERVSSEATAEWFARVPAARKALWNFFKLLAPLL